MPKLFKIIHQSITITSRQPYWWLLALLQAILFSVIGQFTKPAIVHSPRFLVLAVAIVLLAPVTVWFWQAIFIDLHPELEIKRQFWKKSLAAVGLVVPAVLLIILGRILFNFWPIHTVVFAIIASTSGLALLYLVLCDQTLHAATRLALYTWNKKISFTTTAASVLLVAHALSFALVNGVFSNFVPTRVFPVSGLSATIWILLTVLVLFIGYFGAILNSFVVIAFLETILTKKDPEAEKAKVLQAAELGLATK